jgi:hypothetical protein
MYEFTEKQQILIQNFEFGQSPTKFLNSGTVDLWTQSTGRDWLPPPFAVAREETCVLPPGIPCSETLPCV